MAAQPYKEEKKAPPHMQISIDLQTVIAIVSTLVTGIVGGMVWVGNRIENAGEKMTAKMEDIQKEIGRIREDFVDDETCKERRTSCPCVQQMKSLNLIMGDLEKKRRDAGE